MVYREDVLTDTVVHALQHRVVFSVFRVNGKILFNTQNAVKTHVLSNLNGIRTPWSNHFATWPYEETRKFLSLFKRCIAIKPAKFTDFIWIELMVNFSRNHTL